MQERRKKQFFKTIIKWYNDNGRNFNWRKEGCSAYEVLISEILLRRSMAERVQQVFENLIDRYPDSKSLSKANPQDVKEIISPLGLQERHMTLIEAARFLDVSPDYSYEAIKSVKGIGHYTCGAFMIFYRGENCPVVDSNIRRVVTRYFGVKSDDEIIDILSGFKEKNVKRLYYGIIDFGALICKPKPKCKKCPLIHSCKSDHF